MAINVIWADGFDLYGVGEVESIVALPYLYENEFYNFDISTTNPANGTRCLQGRNADYSNYRVHKSLTASADPYQFISQQVQFYGGASNPGGPYIVGGNGNMQMVFVTQTGRIRCYVNGVQVHETTEAIPVNVYVDFGMGFNALSGAYAFFVNGNAVYTGTEATLDAGISEIGWSRAGRVTNGYFSCGCRFDNLVVFSRNDSFTYIPNMVPIYALPNADGSNQDWTPATGSDGFDMINDIPAVPASNYIEGASNGDVSNFNVEDVSSGVYQVYGVALVYMAERTQATTIDMNAGITVNGTDYDGDTVQPPQSSQQYFFDWWPNNPDTGLSWSVADIANFASTDSIYVERTS